MDIKNCVDFSITKDGRTYSFHAPSDGSLGEAYDSAYQVLGEIARRIQESAQKTAPKDAPESTQDN
jgi:hypothetical protein